MPRNVTSASLAQDLAQLWATQLTLYSAEGSREGPGIDFLLPYWLGTHLKVLPSS
jgi:hypothetical protein